MRQSPFIWVQPLRFAFHVMFISATLLNGEQQGVRVYVCSHTLRTRQKIVLDTPVLLLNHYFFFYKEYISLLINEHKVYSLLTRHLCARMYTIKFVKRKHYSYQLKWAFFSKSVYIQTYLRHNYSIVSKIRQETQTQPLNIDEQKNKMFKL